jgi:outer membrane autotransporter protein
MQTRSGGGAWDKNSNKKYELLGGVCIAALGLGFTTPAAQAANFEASNETELYQAIADAQASGDAASTITLTGSFAIASQPPAIAGKAITIETGTNTLTYNSAALFDIASDASLTLSGQIQGSGVLNPGQLTKTGGGELIIDGATGSGITRIGLNGGHTLITGGSEITFATSAGATLAQLGIATEAGQVASLTISGEGTRLVATGSDNTDLVGSAGTEATLTIEDGGAYVAADSFMRVHGPSTGGTATINVLGEGSLLNVEGFGSYGGITTINVLDGGVVDMTTTTSFGGVGNNAIAAGNVTALVSGEGSRWDTGTLLYMHTGSLSILDGGVVTAATVNIGTTTSPTVATNFDVLVSGAGSELSATAINLGTRRTGTLTIADDGRVVVNGGASALVVGGAFPNSDAALNIGGRAGEAAGAAGTLEASSVTLAATAEVNFNHTETGYVFDIPITGSGAINQLAGRTIFNTNQSDFIGLTSVHGGMLEVNGTLGGTMDVRGGTLAGVGSVGNTQNFAGGTIAPGSGGIGTLTVDGDYTSDGGALAIEAELGGDSSPTDMLVITGASILGTGATQVFVTNLGGLGAETLGDGIKIVDVTGASDAGAFALGGPTIGGAHSYALFQNDLLGTLDDGDWYLRAAGLAPTIPVYENYPQVLLGMIALPTLEQRIGDRHRAAMGAGDASATGIWTRIEGAHGHFESGGSTSDASYDADTTLVQAGLDAELWQGASGVLVGGLTAQYVRASADISSNLGDGGNDTDSYGVGATLTWYGQGGFYVDAQAQIASLDSDLSAAGIGSLGDGIDGDGYALSLEAGREMALSDGWSLTPQAQLAWSSVDFDSFTDQFGAEISLKDGDSLKGRIGIAANYEAGPAGTKVYGIANLTYEFLDGTAVVVSGVDASFEPQRFGGELGVGGTYQWAGGKYSLYGEALASSSFEGSYGVKGTAGLAMNF